ncbi:hypothetical protein [Amycolatopsis sp. NPDC004079]|uniref:hypothetical protein n=1 Tax=Amycolatopsis sp. NPDC004079 TaxID=3154549 RepID=UPI0033A268B4
MAGRNEQQPTVGELLGPDDSELLRQFGLETGRPRFSWSPPWNLVYCSREIRVNGAGTITLTLNLDASRLDQADRDFLRRIGQFVHDYAARTEQATTAPS